MGLVCCECSVGNRTRAYLTGSHSTVRLCCHYTTEPHCPRRDTEATVRKILSALTGFLADTTPAPEVRSLKLPLRAAVYFGRSHYTRTFQPPPSEGSFCRLACPGAALRGGFSA